MNGWIKEARVLVLLGADRQTVIEEFKLSADGGVAIKEPCITAILDEMSNRGGIQSFLESCGVKPAQLTNLRTQVQVN